MTRWNLAYASANASGTIDHYAIPVLEIAAWQKLPSFIMHHASRPATQNSFTIRISSLHPSPSPSADTPISLSSHSVESLTPHPMVSVGPEIRDLIKARKNQED